MAEETLCEHLTDINEVKIGDQYVCEECVKQNGTWLHLRTCQTCGVTLCCDSSPQKHMTRHHYRSGHPVMASAEPDERWLWCYEHEMMREY
ncbi:UBP-type zinc finger domain-containing protein [uncultured Mucilaginibacter sp.]|uniref:UBP-type zinc finger domain-containing protein n=1 Tax=uncultured Mucilaginibacter sp. TaxID=797541 RepID=UPI0025FB338C|nr:UBP-type zinc finger domain-containing protein [uncultured Mucilaginibacter sp.]